MKNKTHQLTEKLGFEVSMEGNTVKMTGDLISAQKLAQFVPFPELVDKPETYLTLDRFLYGNGDLYMGGSNGYLRDALNGRLDMSEYQRVLDGLERNGFSENLRAMVEKTNPRMKRRLSDSRGDFEYERRCEDKSYIYRLKQPTYGKTIHIVAHFWVQGMTSAQSIDAYGAACWAISQAIEKAGMQTSITWRKLATEVSEDKNTNNSLDFTLKKPGEYIAPSFLAACFSGVFYRRISWTCHTLAAGIKNKNPHYQVSNRSDKIPSKAASMEGNTLHLTPDVAGYTHKVITELNQFFNQKKAG